MDILTDEDKRTIVAILRTHAELQDRTALRASEVLARIQIAEPNNPLTLAMQEDLAGVEADCHNLERLANLLEKSIAS